MNKQSLYDLFRRLQSGETDIETAFETFKNMPYEDLGFAKLDHHRALRDNFAEVIFGEGKSEQQVIEIFERLAACHPNVIATRISHDIAAAVQTRLAGAEYNPSARLLYCHRCKDVSLGKAAVITAGTADIPVAEEAALCLEIMGGEAERIYDVGVAGIHRLLDKIDLINQAQVIIVIAGMEGALASVVGGLTRRPVIAVPTSVGYGASFGGLAALLAMLNSCASGVGVVNIDNGYGAAALAVSILQAIKG